MNRSVSRSLKQRKNIKIIWDSDTSSRWLGSFHNNDRFIPFFMDDREASPRLPLASLIPDYGHLKRHYAAYTTVTWQRKQLRQFIYFAFCSFSEANSLFPWSHTIRLFNGNDVHRVSTVNKTNLEANGVLARFKVINLWLTNSKYKFPVCLTITLVIQPRHCPQINIKIFSQSQPELVSWTANGMISYVTQSICKRGEV